MATQADIRRIDNASAAGAERAAGRVLASKWDGLSPYLMATIYPVNAQGVREPDTDIVLAPVQNDSFNIELCANWQSPFEQTGPEAKMPSLLAMLQSGTLESIGNMLLGQDAKGDGVLPRLAREITEFSRSGQGRSGMTKLNSTQVFTGAPPVKFSMTLLFRAFSDPTAEVEEPVDQLAKWCLSRDLAPNGNIASAVQSFKEGRGLLEALMPSKAPQLLALNYGGRLFAPVVIESISLPQSVPRSLDGRALNIAVQVNMATLTALDQNDWHLARMGLPTRLFNNQA